jgi:hypothetical protein
MILHNAYMYEITIGTSTHKYVVRDRHAYVAHVNLDY